MIKEFKKGSKRGYLVSFRKRFDLHATRGYRFVIDTWKGSMARVRCSCFLAALLILLSSRTICKILAQQTSGKPWLVLTHKGNQQKHKDKPKESLPTLD